jgi:hypothetical protein
MKLGRFAFGTNSTKANRKSVSGSRKGRNSQSAFVEPLEFRMLLSSTAATLTTPSSTTTGADLVTPAVASGAITLLGNSSLTVTNPILNPIASGENNPTPENLTDLGGTAPNTPLAVTYYIQNNVSGTLTMTGATPVTISGPGAAFFKVTSQPAASVADGTFTSFTITFTPTQVGAETATVTIASSDPAGPFTFAIRALGTTTGEFTLTGNSTYIVSGDTNTNANDFTDFGPTDADGSLPLTRSYSIIDPAVAGTLALLGASPVTITGPGAADYSVTTQPTSISEGNNTSFTITFTPLTAGYEDATVTINSSDPSGPFTFAITGEGLTMTAVGTGGLLVDTTEAGRGAGAANDEILDMEYAGYLTDGTLFDSDENAGRTPFQFELGVGQVIQGWDQGLVGMKIGESRTLIIPPSLGYGSQGAGSSIPGNATLIFETTLLNIISAQGNVSGNWVAVMDGDSNPSTTNATSFGTVTSLSAAPITHTFAINGFGGDLNLILANPAVSVAGSSSFTVSNWQVNLSNTQASFTVTYTPSNNVSTAIVTVANADQADGDPNFTFEVQAQGPTSDDGAATYSASTDDITGFAYNPSDLTTTDSIEIVIAGGPTQTILANEPSPELQSEFGTQSHDFTYAMPVLSVGTHSIAIYAMDPTTDSTTLLATTSVTSQNSLFDDHYYLAQNPDVAAAVAAGTFATGYDHYIKYGQFEGRSPSPYWDEAWYLKENPDVAAAVKAGTVSSGFMQYYQYGQYENRGGLLYFNTIYYLQNNPDVAAAITAGTITSAFEHFVLYGQYEGRSPMQYFSSTVYDADNQDILPFVTGETFSSNFEQFILYGQYEDRIASNFYNEQTYLADNPDVAAAVRAGDYPDGFQQWLEYGQFEGRTAV